MEDKLFSEKENNVLKRFIHRNIVTEEDEIVLNRYAGIGFVQFGFDWDKMEEKAKLTESGIYHLNK
jgi:hypothetical protein